MNADKLRLFGACLLTLSFSGCSDPTSEKNEWIDRDEHLVNAINRVGQRATDAQDEIRRLKNEISDLERRIDRLERK
jgi:hypothetical protein